MYDMPVGVQSTYEIPGMKDMTPDEYMTALNARTSEFQRARRQAAPKHPTLDYFSTLSPPPQK